MKRLFDFVFVQYSQINFFVYLIIEIPYRGASSVEILKGILPVGI